MKSNTFNCKNPNSLEDLEKQIVKTVPGLVVISTPHALNFAREFTWGHKYTFNIKNPKSLLFIDGNILIFMFKKIAS